MKPYSDDISLLSAFKNLRVGQGYDLHRLVEGRLLILGGIEIPHHLGLDGHSDADVLTHAIIDALLGAAKLGDIGRLFPDTDPRYKNANSIELLKNVMLQLNDQKYHIINIDVNIIAEKPKLANYIPIIELNLANQMGLSTDQISIKAKTNEKLGYLGQEQGIACYVSALLLKI
jgi:2-C-methyl-D-erythritol 2,4-cyclodiphosphate synthase